MSTIDKIFYLLEVKNLQQKQLTDYLGIDKSIATQWRTGQSKSYTKYISQIANFFEVSVDYFFSENTEKNSAPPVQDERSAAIEFVKGLSESDFDRYSSVIKAVFPDKFEK